MPGSDLPDEDGFDVETDDFLHLSMTKERRYRHFDDPIPESERKSGFVLSRYDQAHRFHPLLGFTDLKRRVFKNDAGKLETEFKPRSIRYASHKDSAYLQAYAEHLSKAYETVLRQNHLTESVLAYRSTGLTNINHAKSLFDEVKSRKDCFVVAVDVSGFFDTLNHRHLKDEVGLVAGDKHLSGHDWNIYKNVTRYSWVETCDLNLVLGKKRVLGARICSPQDFADHVRGVDNGLVQVHDQPFSIPQGTPVSGLYANIYMLSFDHAMKGLMASLGGSYRRYSDDLAFVVPLSVDCDELVYIIQKHLADYHLCLSEKKTDISRFVGSRLKSDQQAQYLGFVFDGQSIVIRESSLNRYREKMDRGVHAKLVAAKENKVPYAQVYQREVRSRYTHLGKRRNFLKYAYRASDIFGAPEIRQQVKSHVRWFERTWRRQVAEVYGVVLPSS